MNKIFLIAACLCFMIALCFAYFAQITPNTEDNFPCIVFGFFINFLASIYFVILYKDERD